MAALTGTSAIGVWAVGDGVSEPQARGATACGPTGPDLLGEAAAVLLAMVGRGPVRCADVHTALYEAACVLGMGRDRPHRLQLADEAFDLLAEYLVVDQFAVPAGRSSRTVRAWLAYADRTTPRLILAAAAGYWWRELTAALEGASAVDDRADVGPMAGHAPARLSVG
jgi:hypothetical protein